MSETVGYIYILTNPSFEKWVKIGYTDDVEERVAKLNQSECTPFAFRVYATYEVPKRLADISFHKLIDVLAPGLRAVETLNGKLRKREFYAISKEEAYALLEAMADIHDRKDKLELRKESKEEQLESEIAELVEVEVSAKKKTEPISLEEYLITKNQDMAELYRKLQEYAYNKAEGAEMYVLPQYIGWRVNGKYFAELHIQKNRIMMLTMPPKNEYSIGERIPESFLWALRYRTYFDSKDEIEEAAGIIIESYEQRK